MHMTKVYTISCYIKKLASLLVYKGAWLCIGNKYINRKNMAYPYVYREQSDTDKTGARQAGLSLCV